MLQLLAAYLELFFCGPAQRLAITRASADAVTTVGAVLPFRAALAAGVKIERAGLLARGLALAGALFCLPANAQARCFGRQAFGRSAKQHRLRAHKATPQSFARGKFQQQGNQRHGCGPVHVFLVAHRK